MEKRINNQEFKGTLSFQSISFQSECKIRGIKFRNSHWPGSGSRAREVGYEGIFRLTSSSFIRWAQTSETCSVLLSSVIVTVEGTNRQGCEK